MLGATSLLLNGGGLEHLRTISTELHTALDSGDGDTRRFIEELRTFVTTVDEQRDTIISTLENVDALTRAGQRRPRAPSSGPWTTLGPALETLADQRRPLGRGCSSSSTGSAGSAPR